MSKKFKIVLPILKATTKKVVKDGKEVEERYVEGVASNTEIDLQMDRVSEKGIESMKDSLKRHLVKMNDGHDDGWSSEISDNVDLFVDDDSQLHVKAQLNGMSRATDLWYALTDARKKLGLSIGGRVLAYSWEEIKNEDGDEMDIRVLDEIDLDHIAVTSQPANPKTWIGAISKSLVEDENELTLEQDTMKKEKTSLEATEAKEEELEKVVSTKDDVAAPETEEPKEEVVEEEAAEESAEEVPEEEAPAEEPAESEESEEAEEPVEAEKSEDEPADEKVAKEESDEEEPADPEEPEAEEAEEPAEEEPAEEEPVEEDAPAEEPEEEEPEDEPEKEEAPEEDEKDVEKEEKEEKDDEVVKNVLVIMKDMASAITNIEKRLSELEDAPAERVHAEVATKSIGNGDERFEVEELTEKKLDLKMEEEIAELKKSDPNDPYQFSKIQKIRAKYDEMKNQL